MNFTKQKFLPINRPFSNGWTNFQFKNILHNPSENYKVWNEYCAVFYIKILLFSYPPSCKSNTAATARTKRNKTKNYKKLRIWKKFCLAAIKICNLEWFLALNWNKKISWIFTAMRFFRFESLINKLV